jgi:hypothetical protein
VASHLTVFQRTPNTALPMDNPNQDASTNKALRLGYDESRKKILSTFAGFDYEFNFTKPETLSKEERLKFYESIYNAGGLHFWLATYMDVLYIEEYNEEAYVFCWI